MKCCYTGHRNIPAADKLDIMKKLDYVVRGLAERGCTVFNAGGALGFDTLAALAVLRVKKSYPRIKLHLYLPCPQQADNWSAADRRVYERIKEESDRVTFASPVYTPDCMNSRNRALVDDADMCVAYCTEARGGTAYTASYAMDNNKKVLNIAMEGYKEADAFIQDIFSE